jgi:hypothetical protein
MTPTLELLARRAVACPGWRWMPGMLAFDAYGTPARVLTPKERGEVWASISAGSPFPVSVSDLLPDLDDAATIGCVEALLRNRDPRAHLAPDGIGGWYWRHRGELVPTFRCGDGDRPPRGRVEALVAALEAGAR